MVNYSLEELIKWIEANQFQWAKSFSFEGKYLGGGESEPISFSEW